MRMRITSIPIGRVSNGRLEWKKVPVYTYWAVGLSTNLFGETGNSF